MNKVLAYMILIVSAVAMVVISTVEPAYLSDKNSFLKDFINQNILNILGVILAITLASAASIHLKFNDIEEKYNRPNALRKSRENLRHSAYCLIASFVAATLIVIIKPLSCESEILKAIINSSALWVLILHILILIDLTSLVFSIEPVFLGNGADKDRTEN